MPDVGPVAAVLVQPSANPGTHRIAAVSHGADQRLGNGQYALGTAGEVDVVVDVCPSQPSELGRGKRPDAGPVTGVDIDFRGRRKRDATAVGQYQRHWDIATAVAVFDDFG